MEDPVVKFETRIVNSLFVALDVAAAEDGRTKRSIVEEALRAFLNTRFSERGK